MSNAEIVMLRDACENEKELAIIDFLLSTGVRVSECCAMNIRDIDFLTGKVKIYGEKTRKWRTVFLDAAAQKHLKEYLDVRPECDEDAVFVNKRKPHTRVGSHGIEDIAKILGNSVDTLEKYYIIIDDYDIESSYKKCVA